MAVEKRVTLELTKEELAGLPPEVLAELRPKRGRKSDRAVKGRTPAQIAQVFERAAWFLADYSDLYDSNIIQEDGTSFDAECIASRNEMRALATRLQMMMPKQEVTPEIGAATIIAGMLEGWGYAGAVMFSEASRRFRLVGAGAEPQRGEVCVGVYMPGATAEMLAEDFAEVLAIHNVGVERPARSDGGKADTP